MPLYEYECQKCGKLTEILQSRAEADEEVKCPECGSRHLTPGRDKIVTFSEISEQLEQETESWKKIRNSNQEYSDPYS